MELLGGFAGLAITFLTIVLLVLTIFLPLIVYSARNGIYKNHKELKRLNENIESLISHLEQSSGSAFPIQGRA
ncbi:MAG: hypothetical protein ACE5EN_05290 [Nitrospinota bacterium]